MKNNKVYIFCILQLLCWFCTTRAIAQIGQGASDQLIVRKNFLIVSEIEQSPRLKMLLRKNNLIGTELQEFLFTAESERELDSHLQQVYDKNQALVDQLLNNKIRPSGYYSIYGQLPNRELWMKCWKHYFIGINYILNGYGNNGKLRYPAIDSSSYDTKSKTYQAMVSEILGAIQKGNKPTLFYKKPLQVALALLRINGRDEASRFEPIEKKENRAAYRQVGKTDFTKYEFSALVIPGDGPEQYDVKLPEVGKARCKLAFEWFAKKKAPFIIVSGGYCHPFKTQYCEALEMKHYLMENYGIPDKVIIMDPHARHTTTNFRNACRYLVEYGFPKEKPALLLSTKDQTDYIADPRFELRNKRELGYLPYKDLKRLSDFEFSFLPVEEALFRDPIDPLDP